MFPIFSLFVNLCANRYIFVEHTLRTHLLHSNKSLDIYIYFYIFQKPWIRNQCASFKLQAHSKQNHSSIWRTIHTHKFKHPSILEVCIGLSVNSFFLWFVSVYNVHRNARSNKRTNVISAKHIRFDSQKSKRTSIMIKWHYDRRRYLMLNVITIMI